MKTQQRKRKKAHKIGSAFGGKKKSVNAESCPVCTVNAAGKEN